MANLDPVVVVGGSYAGAHAVRTLAKSLPKGQRVILLEERSHMAHLYVLPRFAIVPGFEHQAFVPYNDLFSHIADEEALKGLSEQEKDALDPAAYSPDAPRAQYIQATVVGVEKDRVHFVRHTHKEKTPREAVAQNGNGSTDDEYCGTTAMQVAECEQDPSMDGLQSVDVANGDDVSTVKLKRTPAATTAAKRLSEKIWHVQVDPAKQRNGHVHAHEHVLTEKLEHTHLNGDVNGTGHKVRYVAHSEQPIIPDGVAKLRDSSCGNCASPSSTCCSSLGKPPSSPSSATTATSITEPGLSHSASSTPTTSIDEVLMTPLALREHCAGCLSPSETCCSTLVTTKPVQADCANCASPASSICCQTLQPRRRPGPGRDNDATARATGAQGGKDGDMRSPPEGQTETETIKFSYMIYAAGSRLPHPLIRLPKKKMEAKDWLMENQRVVREASKVLVVGSGALGIQFATDIKSYYPDHAVTLINSRPRFMPLYHEDMHKHIQAAMDELGIEVFHNERLEDMDALERLRDEAVRAESEDARRGGTGKQGRKMIRVRLRSGREVESDLQILCIGQHHNHELISSQEPSLLSDKGSLHVKPTLQLDAPGYDHIFAIGDVANTTAIKAGHVGYWQAGVAVENIVRLLKGVGEDGLKVYEPTKPMIKVTVGKHKAVVQMWDEDGTPKVTVTEDMPEDLQALSMWSYVGAKTDDVYL